MMLGRPFEKCAGRNKVLYAIGMKEEIWDTDPFLNRSYKEIMNMDAEIVDKNVLGLTFLFEVESLGSRREMELCPDGKDIIVDSKNME
ncbi:hypothetical protein MTR67_039329 [Solanum verrucosum]|uniref:HECT domain-containing protein n=1 Tax=Solanum verrucosum TaxID=315347 RepID=A0AAF0UIN7_SOLVR|nr:hypothetical protein MTR67_039329 [Solanum verrucosum]